MVDFPGTAAAKLNFKPSETVGTISASFAAAWTGDADKPADERSNRGTGFGDEIVAETRRVERILGNTRAVISLRYEALGACPCNSILAVLTGVSLSPLRARAGGGPD